MPQGWHGRLPRQALRPRRAAPELALTEKFGVALDIAPALIQRTRAAAKVLGICFHVGSQCMHPDAYRLAIRLAKQAIRQAGVPIESFDVGGGFPSLYPGMNPPALINYFRAIHDATRDLVRQHGCQLLCEPGRALVAESGAVVVRVEARKGNALYINDGTYGALFDAGTPGFIFPARPAEPQAGRGSDRLHPLRPDLRHARHDARAVHPARRHRGGRLPGDRPARRLRADDGDALQRLLAGQPRRRRQGRAAAQPLPPAARACGRARSRVSGYRLKHRASG
ncbi:MAG: hypothetical protein WDN72_07705 [Alphaproteobacteria bacterium]